MLTTNTPHRSGVLCATIDTATGQVTVFDLPAHRAGTPGTVTAQQAAGWTEADWRGLARSRRAALRARQRRAGMHRPMPTPPPPVSVETLEDGSIQVTQQRITREWIVVERWVPDGCGWSIIVDGQPRGWRCAAVDFTAADVAARIAGRTAGLA